MNLPIFKSPHGRQLLSFWASKLFENSGIKRLFGLNLVAAVVFTGVITPEATDVYNELVVKQHITQTPIAAEITTKTTYEMPLTNFRISQLYSFWHPGIDLVAEAGMPIYALESGEVKEVNDSFFGYGKHLIVEHDHKVKALYAHMSAFKDAFVGKQISRGELIGYVGSTGWSTGNHLHIEIYIDNVPVNPMELLPLKKEDVVYDATLFSTQTSVSASASATQVITPGEVTSSPLPMVLSTPTSTIE